MNIITLTVLLSLLQVNSYSSSIIIKVLPIFIYIGVWIHFVKRNNQLYATRFFVKNKILAVFLLTVLVGVVRNNLSELSFSFLFNRILSTAIFCLAMIESIAYYRRKAHSSLDLLLIYIIKPYFLFCLLNTVLWALGFSIKEDVFTEDVVNKKAIFISMFGVDIDRVQFPLAGGLNNYAVIIGALMTMSLSILFVLKTKKYNRFALLSSIVFLLTLLLVDSRTAIFYPIAICIFLYFIKNRRSLINKIPWFAYLIVLGPLLLYLITPLLSSIPFLESLARGKDELASGNSRFVIWSICLKEFSNFRLTHIFGYGDFGHYGSGASASWASLFSTWLKGEYKTPHNTFFTTLFDYGYWGVVLYVLLIFKSLKMAVRSKYIATSGDTLTIGLLIFTILAGITETLAGFHIPNYLTLFILIMLISRSQYTISAKTVKISGQHLPNHLPNSI